jgi:phosphoribosylaminoimidazole-succinocarboxamide synthase
LGIDVTLLAEACALALERTDLPELGARYEGKVRDCYVKGGRRVLVATDRVSAFDVVLGTIPLKGQVLNQAAAFWFEKTREVAPNHLLEVPDPCVSVVTDCRPLPVEFVYRAYLTGSTSTSIWVRYAARDRLYCGHRLPDGLRKHEKLPRPLLTPTTKAPKGEHDELMSKDEILARGLVSAGLYERAEALVAALFAAGSEWAAGRGLILVDTKYELGLDAQGELVVIDEIHTPDSSRYWYRDGYEQALARGDDPHALDKEYVRRWLVEQGWRGEGAPPPLPDAVRCEAARRYIEAYELLSGAAFEPNLEPPIERIHRNLGL